MKKFRFMSVVKAILAIAIVTCTLGSTVRTEASSSIARILKNVKITVTDRRSETKTVYKARSDEAVELIARQRIKITIRFTDGEVKAILGKTKKDPIFQCLKYPMAISCGMDSNLIFWIGGETPYITGLNVHASEDKKNQRGIYLYLSKVKHIDKDGRAQVLNKHEITNPNVYCWLTHFGKGSKIVLTYEVTKQ